MQINGAERQQRGHVLLLAGDIAARRRTVQVVPSTNLAALSVLPVPLLLGSDVPSDTTYLDGIHDQNALQVRLRAAAATPGPLLVYLSGRLTTDRRGQSLYLALPGTTAATTRYAALPWEWLGIELRTRPPGLTTVLFDLAADKTAWPLLQEYGTLPASTNAEVFGVIAPPGFSGTETGVSTYTRAWIDQLRRHPDRPTNSRLHALAVGTAALPPGSLVIPFAPEINAAPSHDEPAARPPKSNLQRLLAGDTSVLPGRRRAEEPAEVAPGLNRMPSPPAPRYEHPAPVPAPQYQAPAPQQQQPAPEFPAPAPRPQAAAPGPSAPGYAEPGHGPVPAHQQQPEPDQQPVRAPHPAMTPPAPAPQTYVPQQAPAAPTAQPAPVHPPVPAQQDPRPHIHALSESGQHREAARLAQAWEQHTLQTHGIDSPQATQWAEIRADLAKREGNYQLATQLWIAAGRTRLAHQAPDAPEVLAAASSAHYCWTQMPDPGQARECGPELISLLRALPTLDRRHLSMAQQRLEFLQSTPSRR